MNALPILLLGGAAVMMMGGKKKPKSKPYDGEADADDAGDSVDDGGGVPTATLSVAPTLADKCKSFIDAVWVDAEAGELPIKSLVVEENILPEMKAAAKQKRKEKGAALSPDFSNTLVLIGFNAIAPDCGWVLTGDGWRFANGQVFEGKVLDVYNALKKLAGASIEEANKPQAAGFAGVAAPGPKTGDTKLGFDTGG